MEKKGDEDTVTVLDALSPALKYEAMLKECGGPGPTEDKMILVFKVLDQIMPHLGVFTKLMKMCRDEIFEAIYSDQYTAGKADDPTRYIQKIPYFILVKRVYDERDERNDNLEEQLNMVKKRLFSKQKDCEEASDLIEKLSQEITELKANIGNLESDLEERAKDIYELGKTLDSEIETKTKMEKDLCCDIAELKEDLEDSQADNTYHKQYKTGYDDLQQGFYEFSNLEQFIPPKKKRSALATKRAHLVSGIENCAKIEEQFLVLQNGNIEEFDKFMEQHRAELSEQHGADAGRELDDLDIDQADQQLQMMEERFKKSMVDITTELQLIKQHSSGLMEQLQILEENKPAPKKKKKKLESRPMTQESSLSQGLDDDEEEPSTDPFIIQERIFSKFAAMLYTSDNNGKTYHEFQGALFCPSCGEKTVLCPHKILQQDHVFPLPFNVTHLKVSRPKVRINMELQDRLFQYQTPGGDTLMSTSPKRQFSGISLMAGQVSPLMESMGETPVESQMRSDSGAISDSMHFTHSVQRLWDDYKSRTELERTVSRQLPLSRALSLIEQCAAYILHKDETHHEDDTTTSIIDCLYEFMSQRYHRSDVAYLTTHDLIQTLIEHCTGNKFIWLFTQVLIGNLDSSVFRYLLLIGDFINQVDWKVVEDFRAFTAVVYPSLTEDDLENLQMGYISFSENKVSRSLVAEYIIYIIMKYREPRFLEMENALLVTPGKESGYMTETEFTDATDQILGVPDSKLRKHLYREAEQYVLCKDNIACGVPTIRLSQISSYLQLTDLSSIVMEHVAEAVISARGPVTDPDQGAGTGQASHAVESLYRVIGMSDVHTLAKNVARRDRSRMERMQMEQ